VQQLRKNEKIMKKITSKGTLKNKDIREEYAFDYKKARKNRFAGRVNKDQLIVMLDTDVSKIFTTPESVNQALRAIITAIPKTTTKRKSAIR
jgi:hypothetical protein